MDNTQLIRQHLPDLAVTSRVHECNWPAITKAHYFAAAAHAAIDQRRKYTLEPYIVHPIFVFDLVEAVGGSIKMLQAALLHDVVEDTKITIDHIFNLFGSDVALLVSDLTDVSRPEDGARKQRKRLDLLHTAKASPDAKTIKLADLIANSVSILEHDLNFAVIYLEEKSQLLEVLQEGNPTLLTLAYEIVSNSQAELERRLSIPK